MPQITHMGISINYVEIPTVGRSTRMHCIYQNLGISIAINAQINFYNRFIYFICRFLTSFFIFLVKVSHFNIADDDDDRMTSIWRLRILLRI